jgi:hypothetical protein
LLNPLKNEVVEADILIEIFKLMFDPDCNLQKQANLIKELLEFVFPGIRSGRESEVPIIDGNMDESEVIRREGVHHDSWTLECLIH